MSPTDQTTMATTDATHETDETDETDEQVLAEDLIEEVSIDGMCGVY